MSISVASRSPHISLLPFSSGVERHFMPGSCLLSLATPASLKVKSRLTSELLVGWLAA
jgi:hypothetical protein